MHETENINSHKETMIDKVKSIRTLTEWPLAKVELVETDEGLCILKTTHPDFKDEIYRQQELEHTLRLPLFVPHVRVIDVTEDRARLLMDYIEGEQPLEGTALQCIKTFHEQTQSLETSENFEHYDLNKLIDDLKNTNQLIPASLKTMADENTEFFSEVFNGPTSVVHGDWKNKQLIVRKGDYYILDFGKSFYGPSILDYAYYFDTDTAAGLGHETYSDSQLLKAKIVIFIMKLAWYINCRDNYIGYDYQKEIGETQQSIEEVVRLLSSADKTEISEAI